MNPPDVYFFNESGRYSPNTKICLNVTSYHKESWSPAWSMRTIMEAFVSFFHTDGSGIGSLFESKDERKKKAKTSRNYTCADCGQITKLEKIIKDAHKDFWS